MYKLNILTYLIYIKQPCKITKKVAKYQKKSKVICRFPQIGDHKQRISANMVQKTLLQGSLITLKSGGRGWIGKYKRLVYKRKKGSPTPPLCSYVKLCSMHGKKLILNNSKGKLISIRSHQSLWSYTLVCYDVKPNEICCNTLPLVTTSIGKYSFSLSCSTAQFFSSTIVMQYFMSQQLILPSNSYPRLLHC